MTKRAISLAAEFLLGTHADWESILTDIVDVGFSEGDAYLWLAAGGTLTDAMAWDSNPHEAPDEAADITMGPSPAMLGAIYRRQLQIIEREGLLRSIRETWLNTGSLGEAARKHDLGLAAVDLLRTGLHPSRQVVITPRSHLSDEALERLDSMAKESAGPFGEAELGANPYVDWGITSWWMYALDPRSLPPDWADCLRRMSYLLAGSDVIDALSSGLAPPWLNDEPAVEHPDSGGPSEASSQLQELAMTDARYRPDSWSITAGLNPLEKLRIRAEEMGLPLPGWSVHLAVLDYFAWPEATEVDDTSQPI